MLRRSLLALALAVFLSPSSAHAQWKAGGVTLPLTPLDDWEALCSDGQGGAYFLSIPLYGQYPRQPIAQHVLADGRLDPLDGTTGQKVVVAPYGVGQFNAVADGFTGVLVTYQRCAPQRPHTACYETGQNRLARWQSGGAPAPWPDTGVVIGPTWPDYDAPPVVAAGDGGAFVLLDDAVRRWVGDTTEPWTPDSGYDGVRVSTSPRAHRNLAVAPDGAGGLWALWDEDAVNGPTVHELRFNHLTPAGLRAFGDFGEVFAATPGLLARQARPDGAGGVYVAWSIPADRPTPADSLLVQRLAPDGQPLWAPGGVPLGPVSWLGLVPCDDDELTYVAVDTGGRYRVQKLSGGAPAWSGSPGGVAVGVPEASPYGLLVQPGADGSLFVAWTDARSGSADPYATLLDAAGEPAPDWTLAGRALASTPENECMRGIFPGSDADEAVVAWSWPDSLYGGQLYDLVFQKVTARGVLAAAPAPPALTLAPPWPNPTRDGWTVRFALPASGRADLDLFDVAGRRVWNDSRELASGGPAQVRITTRGLPEGVYRLRLRSAAGEMSRPLVLMR